MKRNLLTAGGGLLAILVTIALLEGGASVIRGQQDDPISDFTLETPDMSDVPAIGVDEPETDGLQPITIDPAPLDGVSIEAAPMAVRTIAPQQFALPKDISAQPLERIEARKPLSEPEEKPKAVATVLRHPVSLSAGLIAFGENRSLQLEGLLPQDLGRICDDGGAPWPCGAVARTAFRNFLRARALVCLVPKTGWKGMLTAPCTVGNKDPAAWLAENGWGEAAAGSPLESKVKEAQSAGLGFFGRDPRNFRPGPVSPDDALQLPELPDAMENTGPDL
ncbi:thermonuclease family protein [Pararhizobium gei]|uniref:thermonuclease family protein n=1 Tax=Pararhizobium gei TaxID=1395951 RepID=UPI0023DA5689|nr:thermonuclease family protein [Rhizobium gei]